MTTGSERHLLWIFGAHLHGSEPTRIHIALAQKQDKDQGSLMDLGELSLVLVSVSAEQQKAEVKAKMEPEQTEPGSKRPGVRLSINYGTSHFKPTSTVFVMSNGTLTLI